MTCETERNSHKKVFEIENYRKSLHETNKPPAMP